MANLIVLSGWAALISFLGMLFTCVCTYGAECYMTRRTKTTADDYIVSIAHRSHKWFVWSAVIAIFIHVVLVFTM